VLVRGRRPNFVERLILKIAFLGLVFVVRAIRKPGGGLWGVVGTLAFIFLGQKRSLATVDEYGNTGIQRLEGRNPGAFERADPIARARARLDAPHPEGKG